MSDATYKLKESVGVMRVTEGISNDVQIELVNHTDRLTRNKEKLGVIDEVLVRGFKVGFDGKSEVTHQDIGGY
jgi:hypothetical protein